MKRELIGAFVLVMSAIMFASCGKKEEPGTEAGKYVTLPEYKGIEIDISLTDEEVEIMTAEYYFSEITQPSQITNRAVALCDQANIDYEGKKDGIAFAGGTAQGADLLIGSGKFIGGFEEGLIGVMPGETVDLNLRFPDNYDNTELAGQEVVFTVKVNYVSEMEDALVPSLGIENVATVEQLKQYAKENEYREEAEILIMDRITNGAVFKEIPEEMFASSRKLYVDLLEQMGQRYGMDGKTFVEVQGMDYEALLQEYAEEHTRQQLVIEEIADRENLKLSDSDLDSRINEYAQSMGRTAEELYEWGVTRDSLKENFLYTDVIGFLIDNAVNKAAE